MLYICIFNESEGLIEYPEEYPYDTNGEKDWANKNYDRLDLECRARGLAAGWEPYKSEEVQFSFEEE